MRGSSPLTRGKPVHATPPCRDLRLIPAHAGKTTTSTPSRPTSRAHPRSRRENDQATLTCKVTEGLIPAHAGKTHRGRGGGGLDRAHPRSRGENGVGVDWGVSEGGSSPLTRGKPTRATWQGTHPGLIPAHAGKTKRVADGPSTQGAHPRSRGENSSEATERVNRAGSSPLTRGKLDY